MIILINGKPHEIEGKNISHEQIRELSGTSAPACVSFSPPPGGPSSERSDLLFSGKCVAAQDGMSFVVYPQPAFSPARIRAA